MSITPNATFTAAGTTVFIVMSALANEHGAVNLGQGFQDTEWVGGCARCCLPRPE